MKFEVGQVWCSVGDPTMQAEVISVTIDGLHAKLRRLTHGIGSFQLDAASIVAGTLKWQLVSVGRR